MDLLISPKFPNLRQVILIVHMIYKHSHPHQDIYLYIVDMDLNVPECQSDKVAQKIELIIKC